MKRVIVLLRRVFCTILKRVIVLFILTDLFAFHWIVLGQFLEIFIDIPFGVLSLVVLSSGYVCYVEEGGMVACRGWCATLKRVAW